MHSLVGLLWEHLQETPPSRRCCTARATCPGDFRGMDDTSVAMSPQQVGQELVSGSQSGREEADWQHFVVNKTRLATLD